MNKNNTSVPLSPMMQQWSEVRAKTPADTLLAFKLGDFFEFFGEDAKTAARVLQITLTKRRETPMCGVPYHAIDRYTALLLAAGHKVAICEPVQNPPAWGSSPRA